jgi:shikimate dehydrogenase
MQVAKIFIGNRTTKNIYKIIEDFQNLSALNKVEIIPIELPLFNNFITDFDLIINSSPLGMHGQPTLELDLSIAKKNTVIYDIVYKPLMTKLLIDAKKNNLPIITGIGMLIEQAIIGFEMWFGQKPQYNYELEKKLIEIANL